MPGYGGCGGTALRAMVFIDGTNLFYRLQSARLKLISLRDMCRSLCSGKAPIRFYLYTIAEQLDKAKQVHGPDAFTDIRVVLGHGVPTGDGNVKEKGVDALLVADLIYHAAVRNIDYAVLVSADTDFALALRRVEDFGCRTAVACVCADVPDRLRAATDTVIEVDKARLRRDRWAEHLHSQP